MGTLPLTSRVIQVNRIRGECDQKLFDLERKHGKVIEKYQHEFDNMKENMEGQLNRLRYSVISSWAHYWYIKEKVL